MSIILLVVAIGIIGVIVKNHSKSSDNKNKLSEKFKGCQIIETCNYFIVDSEGINLFSKSGLASNNELNSVKINKINDIKIYEDGKEVSAGKAVVGALTFGLVGALIGSNMKTQKVKKMGVKVYSNAGCIDIKTLAFETKKDTSAYNQATSKIDQVYNILLKYNR